MIGSSRLAWSQAFGICAFIALWTLNFGDWGFFLAQVFFDALVFPFILWLLIVLDGPQERLWKFTTDHWSALALINAASVAGRYYHHTSAFSVYLACLLAFLLNLYLYEREKRR